ncbi:MAG: transketolase [Clostridiales bacterium]|nr:transketolase [Clostridiales bacterium]
MTPSAVSGYATAIRRQIISMLAEAGSGHPGGSLSLADILAQLYFGSMNIDPQNPQWLQRDRLVLCKGHAAPALYAALALRGYFPTEDLLGLRKLGNRLQGHPDMRKVAGVDMSTGSLGQGLSAACGMALAGRLDHLPYYVYAILGDGENQEGQVWEAAMLAAHYKLDHLIAFLDHNKLQIDGKIEDVLSPEPLDEKWRAFGWRVLSIDGHDTVAIAKAIETAKQSSGQPVMIIAETIKGKGVSFMENQAGWHGNAPNAAQAAQALAELK